MVDGFRLRAASAVREDGIRLTTFGLLLQKQVDRLQLVRIRRKGSSRASGSPGALRLRWIDLLLRRNVDAHPRARGRRRRADPRYRTNSTAACSSLEASADFEVGVGGRLASSPSATIQPWSAAAPMAAVVEQVAIVRRGFTPP